MRSTWNYSPYSRPDQTSREGGDRFICLFHFTAGTISTVPFGAIGRHGERTGRRSTARRPKPRGGGGAPICFGRNWDEFHHLRLEPFPAGARLMVKWRVGRPPIPPDHPLPSEKSRKRSTKPRSKRGFAFWRNLTIRNAATFCVAPVLAPSATPGRAADPLSPHKGGTPATLSRGRTRGAVRDLSPRLGLHIERDRRARAHSFERALKRWNELLRALDLLAAAAAGFHHLLVVRRWLELGERHHVGLSGVAVGEDVESRLPYRQPLLVVGDHGQGREPFGARHVVVGHRIPEHVGA